MIVVDTSVWVEFLKGNEPYFSILENLLDENKVLVSECIFSELLQGTKSERERKIILQYWDNLPKFSMDGVMIKASLESTKNKWISKGIGLIDSCIIQLGRDTSSQIWSLDNKLNSVLENEEKFK